MPVGEHFEEEKEEEEEEEEKEEEEEGEEKQKGRHDIKSQFKYLNFSKTLPATS